MAPRKTFVPRQRKRKFLERQRAAESGRQRVEIETADSNVEVIVPPTSKEQRLRDEKRARLRLELLAQQDGGAAAKIGGKKAKRLEKYIEGKLRKDENKVLLARLAERKIDTNLFASTRNLGQARETKRQALARGLKEERAGLADGGNRKNLLFEKRAGVEIEGRGEEREEDQLHVTDASEPHAVVTSEQLGLLKSAAITTASGLKRPLEVDDDGNPVLQKKRKRGGVKSRTSAHLHNEENGEEEDGEDEDDDVDENTSEDNDDDSKNNEGGGNKPVVGQDVYEEWGGFSSENDAETGQANGGSKEVSDVDKSDGIENNSSSNCDDNSGSGSDESDSGDDDTDDDSDGNGAEERSSAFKAWAQQQRNEALGFQPTHSDPAHPATPAHFTPRPFSLDQEPLPPELLPTTSNVDRKAFAVTVTRTADIDEARLRLPILAEEQRLMEAIHNNDVVVVCGATGSGKTTQVPQFLFEAGYGAHGGPTPGMIGVTQPRRVAAVSMSKRVGQELGEQGGRVAYQIRFEGSTDVGTRIKFMTDGVLLREVAQDMTLAKYSAVVVDEAHERSVNTDILIGILSRIIKLRRELAAEQPEKHRPLKLIIMSATLRVEDMTHNPTLFATPPPVLEVEGRQHPVTIHFSRRTNPDYVEEAFRKISRGHRRLPPGDFLVFLTGQNEIALLARKLRRTFSGPVEGEEARSGQRVRIPVDQAPVEVEDIEFGNDNEVTDDADADAGSGSDDDDGNAEDPDEFDIPQEDDGSPPPPPPPLKMQILPLYSLLPTGDQMRVFESPPPNTRQVILATNVAETSLTIPGTRYVFDSGRAKQRRFSPLSGVQSFEVGWVSRASAEQRAGRAGRTGPGHCYRLYSSAVFERDFVAHADPELLRMPLEGVALQLKAMNLQKVVNFPFPTPPERRMLARAERRLMLLGAVSSEGNVTKIGRTMSVFPLAPRFARILVVGNACDAMPYTIALVAALSAQEVFIPENQAIPPGGGDGNDDGGDDGKHDSDSDSPTFAGRSEAAMVAKARRAAARRAFNAAHRNFSSVDDRSDAIKLLQAAAEFAHEPTEAWCAARFVRYKAMVEIGKLRRQLTELAAGALPGLAGLRYVDQLPPPTARQLAALKQMTAAGFIDHIALRADRAPALPAGAEVRRTARRAVDVPYVPLSPVEDLAADGDPCVYLHPSSVLARLSASECPEFIVYSHLQRAAIVEGGGVRGRVKKTRMRPLTDITGGQLANLAKGTPLISYGKPIKEVAVEMSGGKGGGAPGSVRDCWVVPYLRPEGVGGGQGWPLPLRKVRQRKDTERGWVVE